jgi:hypothetical protein
MPDNKNRAHLVIAEVERIGFVAGCFKRYWCAVEIANQLLLYSELFKWGESDRIIAQLRNQGFKEYIIKGNQVYFDKGIYGSTDGKYSVAVLPMNKKEFSTESFIRERENYSTVFSPEIRWDKRQAGYFDNFPCSYQIAN